MAFSAAVYTACSVATNSSMGPDVVVSVARVQLLAGVSHAVAWLRYARAHLRCAPTADRRAVRERAFAPLGVVYREPEPTLLGLAIPPERLDGRITVRAERVHGRVRIEVEDNGIARGVGLVLSQSLLGGFGGDLRLEAVSGSGSRTIMELPAAAEAPGKDVGIA